MFNVIPSVGMRVSSTTLRGTKLYCLDSCYYDTALLWEMRKGGNKVLNPEFNVFKSISLHLTFTVGISEINWSFILTSN